MRIDLVAIIKSILGFLHIIKHDLTLDKEYPDKLKEELKNQDEDISIATTRHIEVTAIDGSIQGEGDGPWSHSIVIIRKEDKSLKVVEAETDGIQENDLAKYLDGNHQMEIFPIKLTDANRKIIEFVAKTYVGHKYDYDGIVKYLIPDWPRGVISGDPKAEFCSALVVEVFKGLIKFPYHPNPCQIATTLQGKVSQRIIKFGWK